MPASATVIGALLGLGTQMYSNALRKLPYMRHPWEHVLGMGLGVVFVNQLVKWDAKLQEDLDKMLEKAKAANERRYFELTRALLFSFSLSHGTKMLEYVSLILAFGVILLQITVCQIFGFVRIVAF
ncbi:uncharacterized protein LOC131315204 isoform X1 [Rhododendron vialii]|uniref:uncharacterized protein LOC131315204 isoform X1 n=1 Tax=Rhododendron vialii TaxID=182163 RepID=UPI00265E7898|nr:uncharacterized protein LOC131315204 isoform X1 [Rhododendron vialii]XP_058200310.1 uncharacterized protein LOC131315204 isoform X1 [Rhododendron vialii]XP_058200311.1 uncharacterized protein LOC131315204 isoform X1 [Rhododendron vialii]